MVSSYKYLGNIVDNFCFVLFFANNIYNIYTLYTLHNIITNNNLQVTYTVHARQYYIWIRDRELAEDLYQSCHREPRIYNHITLKQNFSKVYKKASNRFRQLSRMKSYLTSDARLNIIKNGNIITSIENHANRERYLFVKKCLLKTFDNNTFNRYFEVQNHSQRTRNNLRNIKLAKIKLETASRNSFFFGAAMLYNSLPTEIKEIENIYEYKK